MTDNLKYNDTMKAWVVFTGQTDLPWLKILKKGFRHCYILLNDGKHWICIDPLSNYMEVNVQNVPCDFDLAQWMRKRGHTIIAADITHKEKQAPWMLFSCVEAVKRVLGIHSCFIITPWQLYKHLRHRQTADAFTPYKNEKVKNKPVKHEPAKGDLAWEV